MRHPLTILLLLSLAAAARAEPAPVYVVADAGADGEPAFTSYQFGSDHHELDDYTRVTGWQVSERWYFGQQRGEDSALGFVWQREADQVSISTDGFRFTRRF